MSVQQTIASPVSISGIGLHSGEKCSVSFHPAPANTGIVFKRIDLEGKPSIKAHPDNLCNRMRRTALANNDIEIHTPEHMLSAVSGLNIDNLIIELDNVELPGMDGSAKEFVECLRKAEIEQQQPARRVFDLPSPVSITNGNANIIALPYAEGFKVTYTLDDHNGGMGSSQVVEKEINEETFSNDIAPARTFCLAREVEALQSMGLGKGATYQNTCVFDGEKLIDNEFRFENEPAKHKILDIIGDLSLSAKKVNAHIIAVRSGHRENMMLVQAINNMIEVADKPKFVLNIQEILEYLPHRYPILLVDRVIDFEANKRIVAIKNVTINEPFFEGHFPGNPVMPGVLQIEALAQTGAVMLLASPQNKGKIPYFMSIDKAKFRRPVYPGDQMRMEVEALRIRARMGVCKGRILVEGQVCAEAEIRSVFMEQ